MNEVADSCVCVCGGGGGGGRSNRSKRAKHLSCSEVRFIIKSETQRKMEWALTRTQPTIEYLGQIRSILFRLNTGHNNYSKMNAQLLRVC